MRLRSNPALKPVLPVIYCMIQPYTIAQWVHVMDNNEQVAGMKFHASASHIHIAYAAAKRGYGLFLYETVATLTGKSLIPSDSLSWDAIQFWRRNNDKINPMSYDEFYAKWDIDLDDVVYDVLEIPQMKRKLMENNVIMYGGFKQMYPSIEFPSNALGQSVEQQVDIADLERKRRVGLIP